MYTNIQKVLNKLHLIPGYCLILGDTYNKDTKKLHNSTLFDMLPRGSTYIAPSYPKVDIHNLPYANSTFDYVIADQVLEHVRKPWVGIKEVHRVLKANGIAIFTSALIFPLHSVPNDYYRYTPDGLKVLFEDFGIIHDANGTGNLTFAKNILDNNSLENVRFDPVKPGTKQEKDVMYNDNKNLVSVWIIAQK